MSFVSKKPFVILGLFILGLVVLPATIFFFQQRQITETQAEKTVIMSFEPSSNQTAPLQIPAGTTFTLDVFVDPGTSAVSFIKAEMLFDPTKFELAGGFIPNQDVFSQIVEAPDPTPGKLVTTLSIGSDLSRALKAKTRIGTLTLRALNTVPANSTSDVKFGPESQALAVSDNASFDENVIASTVPATVKFNQANLTCGTSQADVMLVIDRSGSMNDKVGRHASKITGAKEAANNFIDIMAKEPRNMLGLSTFQSSGQLNSSLTGTFSTVKNQINAIRADGGTCIECGINKANADITAKKRSGIKNAVILLTDGRANFVEGNSREVAEATAEQRAMDAALRGYNQNDTVFYTIGLGKDVNSDFLTELAESTGGQYYFSPTTDQLNSIYTQISQILAKGSVSGVVFNDTNKNGQIDASEENISGWVVNLYSAAPAPQAISTDSNGTYTFPNLCDGSYTLRQSLKSGWKQTFPVATQDLKFTITNGIAITDQNFGNYRGARCGDTIDNDGNGFIDGKDSTCHKDGNPLNTGSYDPMIDGERGSNTCSDSKDNNRNGKIDGGDPICHVDGDITKPWDPDLPEGDDLADLVVTKTQITYDYDDEIVVCSTGLGIKVTFKNQGKVEIKEPFTVKANNVAVTYSDGLAVGAEKSVFVAAPLTQPVVAIVDAGSQIDELDETNNQLSQSLPQPTQPLACQTPTPSDEPTATPTAATPTEVLSPTAIASNAATLQLNLVLHGIGAGGDNANPTANSLSNKNPMTKERNTVVSIFDVNNNLVASATGSLKYSSPSGSFTGTVSTATALAAGKYSLKVRTDNHLTRLVGGIQTLTGGQTHTVPVVEVVAGDATDDNRLDIRDYNMLLDCYSDLGQAIACNDQKKLATDANDDGSVNQFDYNLLLREISTQPGE